MREVVALLAVLALSGCDALLGGERYVVSVRGGAEGELSIETPGLYACGDVPLRVDAVLVEDEGLLLARIGDAGDVPEGCASPPGPARWTWALGPLPPGGLEFRILHVYDIDRYRIRDGAAGPRLEVLEASFSRVGPR